MVNTSIIAELCIHILTWNVGGHNPKDISLIDVLALNGTSNCPDNKLPDIYVVGFQEVKYDLKYQIEHLFRRDKWTLKLKKVLSQYGYVRVKTEQMQAILVNVWTKTEHIPHINNRETESTGTGLFDCWGNKGAASVRLSLYETGVAFVVAHLAAHDEMILDRVKDYEQIVEKHHYKTEGYHNIFDHAIVFWFGDLNFRLIDSSLDIFEEVQRNNLNGLFALDQLAIIRKAGIAFSSMDEQQPKFPPTFKFFEGTSTYDPQRRPAWCDRVLYKVNETKYENRELKLKQLSYKSHPQYMLSDHKPVTAEFLYTIKDTATPCALKKLHTSK